MRTAPHDSLREFSGVKVADVEGKSELSIIVEVRPDDVTFQVKVDGMKLIAESCVTCPLGLVAILGFPAPAKDFTCDCGDGRCALSRLPHAFRFERRGDEMIWSRSQAAGSRSSLTFDYRQVSQAIHSAMVVLKAVVDAHPSGVSKCGQMMPGNLTYAELLGCVAQTRSSLARVA